MCGGGDRGFEVKARWLIVVRRDRSRLFANLRESVGIDPNVEVVLDRRADERDAAAAQATERRRPLSLRNAAVWEDLGFQLIYREAAGEMEVYEAEGDASPPDPTTAHGGTRG